MGIVLASLAASLLYLLAGEWLPHRVAAGFAAPSVTGWLVALVCILLPYLALHLWLWRRAPRELDKEGIPAPPLSPEEQLALPQCHTDLAALKYELQRRYGWRWKRRLPWLLVSGRKDDVEAAAPGLTQHGWLLAGNVVLLWGGVGI